MKVIITEFQFKNLLLNNKNTIRITESQYERLLLNEQNDFKFDLNYQPKVWQANRDYQIKQAKANVAAVKNWWDDIKDLNLQDEAVKGMAWLDKNIGRPISNWADDRGKDWDHWVKYGLPYIKRDLKRAFGEDVTEGFGMFWDHMTTPSTYVPIMGGLEEMWETVSEPQSYKDVLLGFKKLGEWYNKQATDLYNWFATWTWKDWVDLAAIILYCIPTPLTWAIATGLEVVNIGDSLIKGDLTDAGWRSLGLIGGALLSKAIGGSYKVSQKTIDEVTTITTKATRVYEKSGQKAYAAYIKEALKGADGETEAFFRKLTAYQTSKSVPQSVANDMAKIQKEVESILKAQKNGDVKYAGWSERKIIQHATERVVGKGTWINRIIDKVAPVSSFERKIFLTFYGGINLITFNGYLKQLGITKEQEDLLKEQIADMYNFEELSPEEKQEIIDIASYNLKHQIMLEKNPSAVAMGYKLDKNCKPVKPGKFKIKTISDSSFNNLNSYGTEVDAGGNYEYKVVMNNNVPNDESGVYIRAASFNEGEDFEWETANCDASLKVLKKWCKTTNPNRRTDKDDYAKCINLFTMGMSDFQKVAVNTLGGEKINKVSDFTRSRKKVVVETDWLGLD